MCYTQACLLISLQVIVINDLFGTTSAEKQILFTMSDFIACGVFVYIIIVVKRMINVCCIIW